MVRWLRWHCPPDTGFEIRTLAVWGRARYLSVTEAPHYTNFHTWMGKKHFCFFQTAETGNRTPDSGVKGSGANHYPRAPAPTQFKSKHKAPSASLSCGTIIRRHRPRYASSAPLHPVQADGVQKARVMSNTKAKNYYCMFAWGNSDNLQYTTTQSTFMGHPKRIWKCDVFWPRKLEKYWESHTCTVHHSSIVKPPDIEFFPIKIWSRSLVVYSMRRHVVGWRRNADYYFTMRIHSLLTNRSQQSNP